MRMLSAVVLFWCASSLSAGEKYYVVIFGSQSAVPVPNQTHTWATYVRVIEVPNAPPAVSVDTISWMPASLKIRPVAFKPEQGVNLNVDQSIRYALSEKQHISAWGPFEITAEYYERGLGQKIAIDNGRYLYKSVDPDVGPKSKYIANCVHAVTDMDPLRVRLQYSELRRHGQFMSHFIVHRIHEDGFVVDPDTTHDDIRKLLGIDDEPVAWRRYSGTRFLIPWK